MNDFGLVEIKQISKMYATVNELRQFIEKQRIEKDREKLRDFIIDYQYGFAYRLANLGFWHGFFPRKDVSREFAERMLANRDAFKDWKSKWQGPNKRILRRIELLCDRAISEDSTCYLTEYHLQAMAEVQAEMEKVDAEKRKNEAKAAKRKAKEQADAERERSLLS